MCSKTLSRRNFASMKGFIKYIITNSRSNVPKVMDSTYVLVLWPNSAKTTIGTIPTNSYQFCFRYFLRNWDSLILLLKLIAINATTSVSKE